MKASDLPQYYNTVSILENNLVSRANKIALHSAERELTFQQISNEVNQVGNALKRLNIRHGECVGILAPDSPEWAVCYFGIIKIGAIAFGMNTLLKPFDYEYMLRDCRARALIVHRALLTSIESIRDQLDFVKHVIVIGGGGGTKSDLDYAAWIKNESTDLALTPTHREDFCSLNYSSGTTGEPKGIFHAHKDSPITAQLWAVNVLGLTELDRTFAAAKLFFTYGLGGNLLYPWFVGASCVLMEAPSRVAANVLKTIIDFKPTILFNAPTGYAAILATQDFPLKYDLSSLRLCVSAGESLPASIWHAWKDRTGIDIIDGIGSTENFHIFISNRPGDICAGSSGKPVSGYEVKIVDEKGDAVTDGEIGTLLVKGETAAQFYLHQSEKSRRTFLGDWLFTGDKYFMDEDGYYWHAGRSDDMLKVGGIWVSPVEVESAIISHAAVLECAVIGQPDSANLMKPKAFVVLKEGQQGCDALKEELTAHCKEKIAEYKRPRWIEFVPELPKTATGKIQRFKLRS